MINQILQGLKNILLNVTDIQDIKFIHDDTILYPKLVIEWNSSNEEDYQTQQTQMSNRFKIYLKYGYDNTENSVLYLNGVLSNIINTINVNKTLNGLVSYIEIVNISKENNDDSQKVRVIEIELEIKYISNTV